MPSLHSSRFSVVSVPSLISTRFVSERPFYPPFVPHIYPQKTVAVKEKIEMILSRIDVVEDLLNSPNNDKAEEKRRSELLRLFHTPRLESLIKFSPGNSRRSELNCNLYTRKGPSFGLLNKLRTRERRQDYWKTCGRLFPIIRQAIDPPASERLLNEHR